ncbi:carboxynorspermidine decarboxylase [Clostridium putrefaciens]|uniref:Carboxynorspermidine decarboxylase n=1 Tax=Clostridium putrefaciens TaxID=99675 RepID=A0A381J808_9CLOT|nr:hypothetical protein [Clostridium putrefaciens]SUY47139.1 carboxynorspermidine decarboxylase [Clostridium putrefaciens]
MNTPVYIFSKKELVSNYQNMCSLLKNAHVCYTLKTNAEKDVLKVLADVGASFECASVGEYKRIMDLGVSPECTIFGLPIKPEETIQYVYDNGGKYFVFEELLELNKLIKYAPDSKKVLRINVNDIVSNTIDYGMLMEDIINNEGGFLQYVDGISFHISNNTNVEVFRKACQRVDEILQLLNTIHRKKYLVNIGGGFHLNAGQEFYDGLNCAIEELVKKYDVDVYAEPGESIVGSAGKLYTKVIDVRKDGHMMDVYMDSGVPQGVATRRQPSDVKLFNNIRTKQKKSIYRFMDCTCLGAALVIKRSNLDIQVDDILEFEGCGAYTTVFCNDFHSYEKCPVIVK